MQIQIEPLTRLNKKRKPYQRTKEVESQIRAALATDYPTLLAHAAISNFKDANYLHPECLTYLIRRFHKDGAENLAGELMNRLAIRITGPIFRRVSKHLKPVYIDSCIDSVIHEVTCRLFDLKTDRDDFAQRCFWLWLEARTFNVLRTFLKRQTEDQLTDDLDEAEHDQASLSKKKKNEIQDHRPRPDAVALAAEAYRLLDRLEPEERLLYVLKYYEEWEIENKDSSVRTISSYFNVTPKTIWNRLQKIEGKLQGWLGSE